MQHTLSESFYATYSVTLIYIYLDGLTTSVIRDGHSDGVHSAYYFQQQQ